MTKTTDAAPTTVAADPDRASGRPQRTDGDADGNAPRRRRWATIWFWIRRYLPAEIAGTLSALVAGLAVFAWSASPIFTAVAATFAESAGFYAVLAVVVYREQRRVRPRRRDAALRSVLLLVAEFGPAEVLDTLIIRPGAISLAVWLMADPFWAILTGKLAADIVFYAIAAVSFTITARTGLRGVARPEAEALKALRAVRAADIAALLGTGEAAEALEREGTPLLLLEPERVREQYRRLSTALPFVEFFYAVKALAHPAVIDTLAAEGCGFDVATVEELDLVLNRGVAIERTIFTHPVKMPAEIIEASHRGVRMFIADSLSELDKLATAHPRAQVLLRLAYRNPEAKSDLSAKFGIDVADAETLVLHALGLGLSVVGFSYHVGSQLSDPSRFVEAITQTFTLMDALETRVPVRFEILDIGGGFPVAYDDPVVSIEVLAAAIRPLLEARAGELRIIAEPGRILVAEAATLVTSVCGTTRRGGRNWLYIDDGVYGAYSNVVAEDVHPLIFPVTNAGAPAPRPPAVLTPTTVAGPTCDSADVVAADVLLPELAVGDLLASPVMGAYTVVTATSFNGRKVTPVAVVGSTPPLVQTDAAAEVAHSL